MHPVGKRTRKCKDRGKKGKKRNSVTGIHAQGGKNRRRIIYNINQILIAEKELTKVSIEKQTKVGKKKIGGKNWGHLEGLRTEKWCLIVE